ncbi:MAG: hypothetical protein H3Z53_07505 [archaeon]|nr:hypothetical protein [archaeon]MCP8321497.1 hypothetical protein [archaeon]
MSFMESESVTLEAIYKEVKAINERLDFLEDLIEEVIVRELPKVKLSEIEIEEIRKSINEMKSGNYLTLEEIKSV